MKTNELIPTRLGPVSLPCFSVSRWLHSTLSAHLCAALSRLLLTLNLKVGRGENWVLVLNFHGRGNEIYFDRLVIRAGTLSKEHRVGNFL